MTDTDRQAGDHDDRLMGWPQVRAVTGLSRTTAWRMQNVGDFPRPVRISPGRVGWWQSELDDWKAARAARRPLTPRSAPPTTRQSVRPSDRPSADVVQPPVSSERPSARPEPPGKAGLSRRRPAAEGQIAFDFGEA